METIGHPEAVKSEIHQKNKILKENMPQSPQFTSKMTKNICFDCEK